MHCQFIMNLLIIIISANASGFPTTGTATRFFRIQNRIHIIRTYQPRIKNIGGKASVFFLIGYPINKSSILCQGENFNIIATNHMPTFFVWYHHGWLCRIQFINSQHISCLVIRYALFQRHIHKLVPRTHARHTHRRYRCITLASVPILVLQVTLRVSFPFLPIHGKARHHPFRVRAMSVGIFFHFLTHLTKSSIRPRLAFNFSLDTLLISRTRIHARMLLGIDA